MVKKTNICCLNVDDKVQEALSQSFNVFNGTLGNRVNLTNHYKYSNSIRLLLNNKIPTNIQEYDILILDLNDNKVVPYIREEHIDKCVENGETSYFVCYTPTTIFNPLPVSLHILTKKNSNINRKRPIINIIFQTKRISIPYIIENSKCYEPSYYDFTTYEYSKDFSSNTLYGKEIEICHNSIAHILFDKFVDKCTYLQTFYQPSIFNDNAMEKNDSNFTPLLTTKNGDIVSYLWKSESEITFMLPQLEEKADLLKILFNEILFRDFSEYFPFNNTNVWKDNKLYFLPNMNDLLCEKERIRKKYENEIKAIDNRIEENNEKFSFLHDLLTETGDNLVHATIKFFKWLGFTKVLDKDTTVEHGLFEEDIQIGLKGNGILIVEVKGINGTSTDAECSQISKVRRRREKERNAFDVSALYIVNNERKTEPLKRTLPPFDETKINDAINDERGLAYTWQLFTLYFNIETGVITKEEAMERFLDKGLLDFQPNLIEVGKPYKYFQNYKVACVELNNCEIQVNEELFYEQNGFYYPVKIERIEIDKQSHSKVSEGKVGIQLSTAVPRDIVLYKKL